MVDSADPQSNSTAHQIDFDNDRYVPTVEDDRVLRVVFPSVMERSTKRAILPDRCLPNALRVVPARGRLDG
jgi:hypothetical protein